jgi:hypothetical protein
MGFVLSEALILPALMFYAEGYNALILGSNHRAGAPFARSLSRCTAQRRRFYLSENRALCAHDSLEPAYSPGQRSLWRPPV